MYISVFDYSSISTNDAEDFDLFIGVISVINLVQDFR